MSVSTASIDSLDELLIMMDQNELGGKLWRCQDDIYHACSEALGSSGLRKYELSPSDYYESTQTHSAPSKDMKIGTALHSLVLEGEEQFNKTVGEYPAGSKNSNKFKEAVAEMNQPVLLDKPDIELVRNMADSVMGKQMARGLLSGGESELSAFAPIPDTEIWTKCRMDYLNLDDSYMVDLKTTKSNSWEQFNNEVFSWGYEVQLAYYKTVLYWAVGIEIEGLYILGVQKAKPHKVFPVRIKDLEFDLGVEQMTRYLDMHVECKTNNDYPSNDDEIKVAAAPDWKLRKWGII